jgi:DMSO/TMAO reductase YedYZ molybdopterin-dependent catalytic subunit
MPRFGMRPGLPPPTLPDDPTVTITGDVGQRIVLGVKELAEIERVDTKADFHCVTTWSVLDLDWSGWRMRDLWNDVVVPQAQPAPGVTHIRAISADGYSSALELGDALMDDVLIADRLGGRPLEPVHGSPFRLVAPAHYAYKSVKHLAALTVHSGVPRTSGGSMQHPRGRVEQEERHGRVAGRLLRWPYRLLVVPTSMWAQRALGKPPSS